MRLRVIKHTDKETLVPYVYRYTGTEATVYTDEWRAYERVVREHRTVSHGIKEWARDETTGMGTGRSTSTLSRVCGRDPSRNFLRSFRGVHKKYLAGYVAMCEFAINLKRVSPDFVSSLVAKHPV